LDGAPSQLLDTGLRHPRPPRIGPIPRWPRVSLALNTGLRPGYDTRGRRASGQYHDGLGFRWRSTPGYGRATTPEGAAHRANTTMAPGFAGAQHRAAAGPRHP